MDTIVDVLLAIASAATTLVAAYYGAKFAFEFQNGQLEKQRAEEDVKSMNMTILKMMASHHQLTAYKKQFIEPELAKPDRHFSIMPTQAPLPALTIELDRLAFLIRASDPNLINELSLALAEINSTIELINTRSHFHANELQPRLEAKDEQVREAMSLKDLEQILGRRVTVTMRKTTDSVIEYTDESLAVIERTTRKLHLATKEIYPTHLVARMDKPVSAPQT